MNRFLHRVPAALRKSRRRGSELRRSRSGLAAVEFAMALPFLMTIGMYATEIAYMSAVNMQVSQLAVSVADNASRMEQTDNSGVTPTVTEADVDSIMAGALSQGESFDFEDNGRVILSSLERDNATGKQYIHWQRCTGKLAKASAYGNDTDKNGLSGTPLPGMGIGASKITASAGSAVMYAEVYYRYRGLFGTLFVDETTFREEAAFLIRDIRNLTPGISGSGGTSSCT